MNIERNPDSIFVNGYAYDPASIFEEKKMYPDPIGEKNTRANPGSAPS